MQWEKSVGTLYNHYLSDSQEFGRIFAGAACKQPNSPRPNLRWPLSVRQLCSKHGVAANFTVIERKQNPHNNRYKLPFSDLDSHTVLKKTAQHFRNYVCWFSLQGFRQEYQYPPCFCLINKQLQHTNLRIESTQQKKKKIKKKATQLIPQKCVSILQKKGALPSVCGWDVEHAAQENQQEVGTGGSFAGKNTFISDVRNSQDVSQFLQIDECTSL